MDHREKAAELFVNGKNCAQAVAVAFCDVTHMEPELAAKLSSSFGGGMGRMREVINALAVADCLEQRGVEVRVQTAIAMNQIAELCAIQRLRIES